MWMNQNSNTVKTILSQTTILGIAIIISLILIILISNIAIFPIVLFSQHYPKLFTQIVEVSIYLGIILLVGYIVVYRLVALRKVGVPISLQLKNIFLSPLRYIIFTLLVVFFIILLLILIYFILKTNYIILHKLIY